MQRDMDLVRRIALATAELKPTEVLTKLEDTEDSAFVMHVQWMAEAGLLHATLSPKDSKAPATFAAVFRLTWAGCEFADAARSETIWNKAKASVLKPDFKACLAAFPALELAKITQGFPTIRGLG